MHNLVKRQLPAALAVVAMLTFPTTNTLMYAAQGQPIAGGNVNSGSGSTVTPIKHVIVPIGKKLVLRQYLWHLSASNRTVGR